MVGLPTILWAFVWIAFVHDEPSQARWMTTEATARLQTAIRAQQPSVAADEDVTLRSVLFRPDILLLCAHYFCWSLGVYGFVLWLPTIVRRGAAVSMGTTGLLSAVPYLLSIGAMLAVAHVSDRTLRRRELVWPCLLLAGAAMLGSFALAQRSFMFSYVCLVLAGVSMYAPYGIFFALIPERAPWRFTGEALAMVNSFGALGGFAGTYVVGLLHAATGGHRAGDLLMSLSLIVSSAMMFFLPGVRAPGCVTELKHA